uniref:Uncharacterized protein n=1 Tax=Zea mays TaxID=4577 RepID=C4J6N3_MAIZE|nr:unknown [Zea mays]
MKSVLVTPTAQVVPRSWLSLVMPAALNTRGLYSTTASMPDACWKKWMPMPERRMRRMAGVGDRMSSFHTRASSLSRFFGTATTSPSSSCGMPAAALMSASLSAASSGVSEVFPSTTLASARRPFMTSHRGDSGMPSTMRASTTDGAAPMPSITRQPRRSGRREKA